MNSSQSHIEEFVILKNGYKLWTRRSTTGTVPVVLVHGGPGGNSALLQPVEEELRNLGFQTIVYHQLGSIYSDNPNDPTLWTIDDFTNHLEEVCNALNLKNFYIFGYSWGVVLTIEYALRNPNHLRGIMLSNFTASAESFEQYMQQLRANLSPESKQTLNQLEKTHDFSNPAWGKIITEEFMPKHFCILKPWPNALTEFMHELNWKVCLHFFGQNDFAVTGAAKNWNRWSDLPNIPIPALFLTGISDQCNPKDAEKMGHLLPNGSAHIINNASHVPFYENPSEYFKHIEYFLKNTSTMDT